MEGGIGTRAKWYETGGIMSCARELEFNTATSSFLFRVFATLYIVIRAELVPRLVG